MFRGLVNKLAQNPAAFSWLRRILEQDFKTPKALIRQYLQLESGKKVLDLGCGTGEFSVLFPASQYTGVDIEPAYVVYAKRHFPGKFLVADARRLPFAEATFERVLIVGVLHHLSDEHSRQVLAEVRRVLANQGKFLLIEDLESPGDSWVTKRLHQLDQGRFIRPENSYKKLVENDFQIIKEFKIRSGLLPYLALLLEKHHE